MGMANYSKKFSFTPFSLNFLKPTLHQNILHSNKQCVYIECCHLQARYALIKGLHSSSIVHAITYCYNSRIRMGVSKSL